MQRNQTLHCKLPTIYKNKDSNILTKTQSNSISLESIVGNKSLEIVPEEIVFANSKPGQQYQLDILIRNITKHGRRLRIIPPKNSSFQLIYDMPVILASGLSVSLIVAYDCKQYNKVQSDFKVSSDLGIQQTVKLFGYPPQPLIFFQPFLNFGLVKAGGQKQDYIYFINEGQGLGQIQLIAPTEVVDKIIITPRYFQIAPNQKIKIKVIFKALESGFFRTKVKVSGNNIFLDSIQITSTSIQFSRNLIDNEGQEIKNISFGTAFYGQKKIITTQLVNNTPKKCFYKLSFKFKNQQINYLTPAQTGKRQLERCIFCSSNYGHINSYSSTQLKFQWFSQVTFEHQRTFHKSVLEQPSIDQPQSSINQNHKQYFCIINFDNQQDNNIIFGIDGNFIIPKIKVSTLAIHFQSYEKSIEEVLISNLTQKNCQWKFRTIPNFRIDPKTLFLSSEQTKKISIEFKPKNIGQTTAMLYASMFKFYFQIRLVGYSEFSCLKTRQGNSLQVSSILGQNLRATSMSKLKPKSNNMYSLYMDKMRQKRQSKLKQKQLQKKWAKMQTKYKQLGGDKEQMPLDLEFYFGGDTQIDQMKLRIRKPKDPLFKVKFKSTLNSKFIKANQNLNFDSLQSVPKLQSQPKNHQQQRQAKQQLKPQILQKILVGPSQIDFKTIFINSRQTRYFHIYNLSQQTIYVQGTTEAIQLKLEQQGQYVPPGCNICISVQLNPIVVGYLQAYFTYIINGIHSFKVRVISNITPVQLILSESQLKFVFNDDSTDFSLVQKIQIKNKGNNIGEYSWNGGNCFTIQPKNGKVNPLQTIKSCIKYTPKQPQDYAYSQQRVDQQKLRLKIVQGKQLTLKCIGTVTQGKLYIKSNQINLGDIIIGQAKTVNFSLKNISRFAAVYRVVDLIKGLQVNPKNDRILPQGTKQISISITRNRFQKIDQILKIQCRGGKSLSLLLKGQVINPNITYQPNLIDFGKLTVLGNASQQQIYIINNENIPVMFQLKKDPQDQDQQLKCFKIWIQRDQDKVQILKQIKNIEQNTHISGMTKLQMESVIRIQSKAKIKVIVEFLPHQILDYHFTFPFHLLNCPQQTQERVIVLCQGVSPFFLINPQSLDFKRVTIIDPERTFPKVIQITMTNPTDQTIDWMIKADPKQLLPFKLQSYQGKVLKRQEVKVKAYFEALVDGTFVKELDIHIQNENITKNKPYIKLKMKGQAQHPCICFDCRQVILPVVPLKTYAKTYFTIYNRGYDNVNIQYRIIQKITNIDISLNFVEGTNLGVTKKSIKVDCKFKSSVPVSFTLIIEFSDNNDRIFRLPISGTSDNCILTNYPYFQQNQHLKIQLDQNNFPVLDDDSNNYQQWEFQQKKQIVQGKILLNYLNRVVLRNQILKAFPDSLIQYQGFLVVLEKFAPEIYKVVKALAISAKVSQKLLFYEQIIKMLKLQGAFLNHIRPYFLLSLNELQLWQKDQNFQIKSTLQMQQQRCLQSWMVLIYQLIKIFQLNKYNIKSLLNYPLPDKKISNINIQDSIIISIPQQVIFTWLKLLWSTGQNYYQYSHQWYSRYRKGEYNANAIGVFCRKIVPMQKEINKKYADQLNQKLSFLRLSIFIQKSAYKYIGLKQALLQSIYLYQNMSHFVPKSAPLIFSCNLGQSHSKSIQVTNNSKQQLVYEARIEGSKDFYLQNDYFKIMPKETYSLGIKFVSRVSQPSEATLLLTSQSRTLICKLQSNITGRFSSRTYSLSTPLYQTQQYQIQLFNQFKQDAQFLIKLQQVQQIKKKKKKSTQIVQQVVKMPSIICKLERVYIKKQQKKLIIIINCPCYLKKTKCYLRLVDPKVGQLQYQILSDPSYPTIYGQTIKLPNPIYVNTLSTYDYAIPSQNYSLLKAIKQLQMNLSEKRKHQSVKFNFQHSKLYHAQIADPKPQIKVKSLINFNPSQNQNNFIKSDQRKLKFTFMFKQPVKDFSNIVIIKSQNLIDVRCYKLSFNVFPKIQKLFLQLNCQLKQQVTQSIPLINNGQKDWTYRLNLQNDPTRVFLLSDAKQVVVPCKKTYNLGITFRPKTVTSQQAKLIIFNNTTYQTFQIQLKGIGHTPEPSNDFQYKLEVGEKKEIFFQLQNNKGAQTIYNVNIDLQNAQGQKQVKVDANSIFKYKLTLNPLHLGVYQGNISFYQKDGKQFWYGLTVNTQQSKPLKIIQMRSFQRQKVTQTVKITNPLKNISKYQVNYDHQWLFGEPQIQIKPNSFINYTINYLPLKAQDNQTKVTFYSKTNQQFYYVVKKVCLKNTPIKIPQFKTQLGTQEQYTIQLTNPSSYQAKINWSIIRGTSFYVDAQKLTIPSYSTITATICFAPSKLQNQIGQILFQTNQIGSWQLIFAGMGLQPTVGKQKLLYAILRQQVTDYLIFKNPFYDKIIVTTQLQQDLSQRLQLIQKSSKHQLNAKQTMQLGIVFKPNQMRVYNANIYINLSNKVKWTYPIKGIVQYYNQKVYKTIKSKCRDVKQQILNFKLSQVDNIHLSKQKFVFELVKISEEEKQLVDKFVNLYEKKNSIRNFNQELLYTVHFQPYRPFKAQGYAKIYQPGNCIWYFKIYIQALHPDPDDKILIESNLHKLGSVSFRLTNRFKYATPFRAFFSTDSDSEFMVMPKFGELTGFGKQGTKITLSFHPSQYRKNYNGTLYIQTVDMIWIYQIKGMLPKYNPPDINLIKPKVRNK